MSIVELHLDRTYLGGDGRRADAAVFASLLREKPALAFLSAGQNGFVREDTRLFAEGAANARSLTKLDLHSNVIDLSQLRQALCLNRTLTCLELSFYDGRQDFSADEVKGLLIDLPWMQDLALHNRGIDFTEDPSSFAHLVTSNLTALDVSNNKLGDEGMRALAEAAEGPGTRLQTLMLAACEIGDLGAKHLGRALDASPTLTKMDLMCNGISKEAFKELAPALGRSTLKDFLIHSFEIDKKSLVNIFAEVLAVSSSLTCLDFDNPDDTSVMDWSPLCNAMKVNTTLLHLCADYNEPWSPARAACQQLLRRNALPQLLLQLRSGHKAQTWKLELLRMSGAPAASLEVEPNITAGALQELVEATVSNAGRVIVLLPTGERLHRVPQESPVVELLLPEA